MWNSLFADNCHKLNVFGMCAKHPKVRLVGEYISLQIILRINIRLDRIILLPFHKELKAHFKIAFFSNSETQLVINVVFYSPKINN